jgi:hypothetical protein
MKRENDDYQLAGDLGIHIMDVFPYSYGIFSLFVSLAFQTGSGKGKSGAYPNSIIRSTICSPTSSEKIIGTNDSILISIKRHLGEE